MKKLLFFTLPILAMLSACSSPAEVISKHFVEMSEIAAAHSNDCDAMGNALQEYLDTNLDSLKTAILNSKSSEASQARQIYRASSELHHSTEACHSESMESFRKKLSEVVLLSTSN